MAAALIAAAAGSCTRSHGEPKTMVYPVGRAGSVVVHTDAPLSVTHTPETVHLVYRLLDAGSGAVAERTEDIRVQRPFEQRLEQRIARRVVEFEVAVLGRRITQGGGASPLVLDVPPELVNGIPRADVVLPEALRLGVGERRETREVASRRCQVYRTGGRLLGGALSMPTASDHVDSCVDEAGLVLEEIAYRAGRPQSRRVATKVEENGPLAAGTFSHSDDAALPVSDGGGSSIAMDPASRPIGRSFELPAPPEGFVHAGRYQTVPPQPENFTDPLREGYRRAATVDVFTRGADVVLLEQGATLHGLDPFAENSRGAPIDLPPLGAGEVLLTGAGVEVRAVLAGGRYVRVVGTMSAAELARLVGTLVEVDGTGLIPLR
jgi:hypothetical protein